MIFAMVLLPLECFVWLAACPLGSAAAVRYLGPVGGTSSTRRGLLQERLQPRVLYRVQTLAAEAALQVNQSCLATTTSAGRSRRSFNT